MLRSFRDTKVRKLNSVPAFKRVDLLEGASEMRQASCSWTKSQTLGDVVSLGFWGDPKVRKHLPEEMSLGRNPQDRVG